MASLVDNHIIRLRSWLDDYLVRPDDPSTVTTRKKGETWPAPIQELWFVREGNVISPTGPPVNNFSLKSWRGDHLALAETSADVLAQKTINPSADWDAVLRNDGLTELRCHRRNKAEYLHRPSDGRKDQKTLVSYDVDGVTGNNWLVEDLGRAPQVNAPPLTDPLKGGDIVRLRSFRDDVLIPDLENGRIKARKHMATMPFALHELWKVHDLDGGFVAFQSVVGWVLTGTLSTKSGSTNASGWNMGDSAAWSPIRRSDGKWELRNKARSDQYLHRRDDADSTTVWGTETSPGNHWTIERLEPEDWQGIL